jgi:hypothetical protein
MSVDGYTAGSGSLFRVMYHAVSMRVKQKRLGYVARKMCRAAKRALQTPTRMIFRLLVPPVMPLNSPLVQMT